MQRDRWRAGGRLYTQPAQPRSVVIRFAGYGFAMRSVYAYLPVNVAGS
jgi:hypothetical protein